MYMFVFLSEYYVWLLKKLKMKVSENTYARLLTNWCCL